MFFIYPQKNHFQNNSQKIYTFIKISLGCFDIIIAGIWRIGKKASLTFYIGKKNETCFSLPLEKKENIFQKIAYYFNLTHKSHYKHAI